MKRYTYSTFDRALTLSQGMLIQMFATKMVIAHPNGLDPEIRPWSARGLVFGWSYPYTIDVWAAPDIDSADAITVSVTTVKGSGNVQTFKNADAAIDFIQPFLRLDANLLPR